MNFGLQDVTMNTVAITGAFGELNLIAFFYVKSTRQRHSKL